jgi:hypothetical protein
VINSFIKYSVGDVTHIRPVQALSVGGIHAEKTVLTLHFPRTPPLVVRCTSNSVADGLLGVLMAYLTDQSSIAGLPGYSETILDLNLVIEAIENAEKKLTASEPSS